MRNEFLQNFLVVILCAVAVQEMQSAGINLFIFSIIFSRQEAELLMAADVICCTASTAADARVSKLRIKWVHCLFVVVVVVFNWYHIYPALVALIC